MAIPTTLESLSVTAASNGPSGSDQRTLADDGLRQAFAFVKQLKSLATLASNTTVTPPSTANVFSVTGTTAITTIASTNSFDGRDVWFVFAGILTFTHGSNLILPGGANITTAVGDTACMIQIASGQWRCAAYQRADGSPILINLTVSGNLVVNGDTTLGNAVGDALTVAPNAVTWAAQTTHSGTHIFSGAVKANSDNSAITVDSSGDTTIAYLASSRGGVEAAYFGNSGATNQLINGSAKGDQMIRVESGNFIVSTDAGASRAFGVGTDGRVYGTALHNNANAPTGTSLQYVASGTYTPTLTNVTSVSASTSDVFQWIRVGNVVSVTGRIASMTVTAAPNEIAVDLPIASDIASATQCVGTAVIENSGGVSPLASAIIGDATNDRARILGSAGSATFPLAVSFTYLIS